MAFTVTTYYICHVCGSTIDIQYTANGNITDIDQAIMIAVEENKKTDLYIDFDILHMDHLYKNENGKLTIKPIG